MPKKVVSIFIDGNNFYHNSKKIMDIKKIDFVKISKFICEKFGLELKEIRYYNSIPDISDDEIIYYNHIEFLEYLKKQGIKLFTRKLQKNSNKELLKEKRKNLNSLDLCEVCKPLMQGFCSDCIGNVKKREKGIDIKIASDMIRKCLIEKQCDVCILISGDADFIPVMQTIKDSKKEVITASVFPGYSRELRGGKFRYLYLKKEDLVKCMKDYKQVKNKK